MIIISWILLIIGAVFILTSAVGCYRFPDIFTKMHAASIAESGGALCIFAGLIIQNGLTIFSAKLLLLMIIMLITCPTACNALARSAIISGQDPIIGKNGRNQ